MRNLILSLLTAIFLAAPAGAQQATIEANYSQVASSGVLCSSGTTVQINSSVPDGFTLETIGGYRIQNQGSENAWLDTSSTISTHTVSGTVMENLGFKLVPGGDVAYHLGRHPRGSRGSRTALYCKAADAASTDGVHLTVEWFGY